MTKVAAGMTIALISITSQATRPRNLPMLPMHLPPMLPMCRTYPHVQVC
uniref:Uncharacterized protein n=1 Tax=Picea glauca TaxID=3330 RepID=A0A101LX57_PICGL|nr:hypothetical protein ABT39_MTgene5971 [Picea glauca]